MRRVLIFFVILLISMTFVGAVRNCNPDYNIPSTYQYHVVQMTDDLYCPYPFVEQALWIYNADGLVLDCQGHVIGGESPVALRVENTRNLTIINCTLESKNDTPILYVNSTKARIVKSGTATAFQIPKPKGLFIPPIAEKSPIFKVVAEPFEQHEKNNESLVEPKKNALTERRRSPLPYIFILLAFFFLLILFIHYRGKRIASLFFMILPFALFMILLLALLPSQSEAACSGTACSFTSSNCGGVLLGCVNQCSGTASCGSISSSGPCTYMGCDWHSAGTCGGTPDPCLAYDDGTPLACTSHGCTVDQLNPVICIGTPFACSYYSDQTSCTGAGCTYYSSATCDGTASSSCTSHYYKGDSNCYTCADISCSYNTQCGQGSTSCGYSTQTCSSKSCSSCPVGGCTKSNTCSCTSSSQCYSNDCASDYSGGGYCCNSGQCGHSASCYNSGTNAPDCYSASDRRYCSSGSWLHTSCGTDSCSDTGSSLGGGTCTQTDYYCSGGSCGSTPSSYNDACSGTIDNPSVTYYYCSGSSCASTLTSKSDSCTDSGGSSGGGSCSATDWDCSGNPGQLSSTSSSKTDSCVSTCQLSYSSCTASDGSVADTCSSYTNNPSSKVCSSGSLVDATSTSLACDSNADYQDCTADACSGNLRYSECNGAGSCDTTASTYYQKGATKYATTGYTLTSTCGTSGTTLCGTSGYNGCAGAGSPYTCQKKQDQLRCDASHTCAYDVGDTLTNVPSGYVCEGTGNEVSGSSTYYAFSDTSDRCSSPGNPDTGFGDRVYDVFACNGANGQGPDVGDKTIDCGTGCCYDAGSTTSCVASGSTTSNFYDFGTGDGSANDYCLSAKVYDCSSTNECQSGYSCSYKNCLTAQTTAFKDAAGTVLGVLDQQGRWVYKGTLYENTANSPDANSIIFALATTGPKVWLTPTTGDLYLKGTVQENQSSLTPPAGTLTFANSTTITSYIDASGNLYTRSTVHKIG